MARLDARVAADIEGKVLISGSPDSGEKRYNVLIRDISIGGALLSRCPDVPAGKLWLLVHVDDSEVTLSAQVVRDASDSKAVEFFWEDYSNISVLWNRLKGQMGTFESDHCPYCGRPLIGRKDECRYCNFSLRFYDADYLDIHWTKSFQRRLQRRLECLDAEKERRLLSHIDRELFYDENNEEELEFVGTSQVMLDVFSMIRKVAPTEIPVLIFGESGTGKELATTAIHERSLRKHKPIVVINCAAIPETLLEAELFGYERGSFTGAYNARKGKVEQADGGTLFLDEIGELPLSLQAKLLRFLEDGTFERIGSRKQRKVDVRIVTATNRDLSEEINRGHFREDLYYRLSAFVISLPPLRERGEDKIILARYFLKKVCSENGMPKKRYRKECLDTIMDYDWRGNVREMINKVRRAVVMSDTEEITPADLGLSARNSRHTGGLQMLNEVRHSIERETIIETIAACRGNLTHTAKVLGISRPTLYKLKNKYHI